MTPKEILKEAFDSDIKVLEQAYESDEELMNILKDIIGIHMSIIWQALIDKGIVTMNQYKEYLNISKELLGGNKEK